jgi:cell wall-associated NlpC family hydrolase
MVYLPAGRPDMTLSLPIISAGIGAAALTGLTALLLLLAGAGDATTQEGLISGAVCATSGPIAGVPDVAAANGRVVAAVAVARGGDQAALIALITGLAESGLRVLTNPHDPAGNAYASQGVGSDHASLGIFQQQPWWGTAAARMEPVASTNIFLDHLLAIPNWQAAPPWEAAQQVQASAFAGGSNYREQMGLAVSILTAVKADSAALKCGSSGIGQPPADPVGPAGLYGLPAGYTVPAGTSPAAAAALAAALSELGKPYVFGATGPAAFDCSGLMVAAWAAGGHALSRTTYTQIYDGTATTAADLAPGDLVLTPGSDGTLASPGHVGMFIGHGLVVEAPHTGDVVRVVTYTSLAGAGVSALRHIA